MRHAEPTGQLACERALARPSGAGDRDPLHRDADVTRHLLLHGTSSATPTHPRPWLPATSRSSDRVALRGGQAMMGTKARSFAPLCNRSIEDLVPADNFYRHLEAKLDLGFVRDLVRSTYKECGRPSVDPRVFFKLQLVMFFEGIRSERAAGAGRRRSAERPLVPRLRPGRGAARSLQPDQDSAALRPGGLPPLLRDDRRAVPRGWAGLGQGAVLRRHPGQGQRLARLDRPTLRGRGAPRRAVHR